MITGRPSRLCSGGRPTRELAGVQPENWRATNPRTGGHQPENWQVRRPLLVRGPLYAVRTAVRYVVLEVSLRLGLLCDRGSCSSSSFSPSFSPLRPVSFSAWSLWRCVVRCCNSCFAMSSLGRTTSLSRGRKYVCFTWISFVLDGGSLRARGHLLCTVAVTRPATASITRNWCYGGSFSRLHRTESPSLWSWVFRQRCRHSGNMSCCQVADGLLSVASKNGLLPTASSAGIGLRAGGKH